MELFKKLFSSLNRASIKYMVAGGIAVNLYGIERATADVDIVLDLKKGNSLKFIKVVERLGLKPKIPVKLGDFIDPENRKRWRTEKGMLVFSLYDPKNLFFLIDIFTDIPFEFDEVYKQRKRIKFENIFIPVVPIKELIAMKEASNRPQDRADVFYLKKIMREWMDEKRRVE
ncbi:MAG TPA: hypothetical protein VEK32_21405 [Thermodesulfobacteriota bacterium]|nr:hypothetical protein [Thermodesulfobacteriota bacterium]